LKKTTGIKTKLKPLEHFMNTTFSRLHVQSDQSDQSDCFQIGFPKLQFWGQMFRFQVGMIANKENLIMISLFHERN